MAGEGEFARLGVDPKNSDRADRYSGRFSGAYGIQPIQSRVPGKVTREFDCLGSELA